jgi:DNA-directed RNA polymerase subunit RPC12/RpoP
MVRLACERCGKRYAVQGEPAPGRKYRVTCKACGHVILFTGGEALPRSTPEPPPASVEIHAQSTAAADLAPEGPGPDAPEPARDPAAPPPAVGADPAGSGGARGSPFVELFGDGHDEDVPGPENSPTDDPPPWREPDRPPQLPEGGTRAARSTSAGIGSRPSQPEEHGDPPPERRGLRSLAIGVAVAWVVVVASVFGAWVWRRSHPVPVATAGSTGTEATSGAPAPSPPVPPADEPAGEAGRPEPAAPPAAIGPEAGSGSEAAAPEPAAPAIAPLATGAPEVSPPPAAAPARPEERPARPAPVKPVVRNLSRPERRATPRPAPAPAPSAVTAPEPEASASASSLPVGLTDDEIQKVLGTARTAFQKCLRDPSRGLTEPIGGRQVTLRFNVSPSGEVSYATIDDVAISSAPVGQCLKTAARGLVFPAFRGDSIKVDAPVSIPDR